MYSRLAGYPDTNDADRLAQDPALRLVVSRQASEKRAAARTTVGRFETELLASEENRRGLVALMEIAHCVEDSIGLIDTILGQGIQSESVEVHPQVGSGVGAIEAPRGTLFHDYECDAAGRCVSANLSIPTAQNLANLEADMRELVPQIATRPEQQITQQLEMLVRAYDPCISCATHMLTVEFR